jgi:hypothetical protein
MAALEELGVKHLNIKKGICSRTNKSPIFHTGVPNLAPN